MARGQRTFDEWRQEMAKAPAGGGIQTPIPMYSPPSAIDRYAMPSTTMPPSRYASEREAQPPNFIADVDDAANFFSPFQPIAPFGPPNITRPREWDYPVGYNLNYVQPRIELMTMLRGMRASWGVLATIIATRQDQLLRIPWTIQLKDKPTRNSKAVDAMRQFFRRPDGILSYGQWTRLVTDDLLVLDAPCIYLPRDRGGRITGAERIDPITIFPLIDDAGRRPQSTIEMTDEGYTYLRRQPAFQQIIKGQPLDNYDDIEIMYVPMRPRAELPMFGYPGTEQILVEASEAIRKTFYQSNFWQEGTIPDLVVTVPNEWTPNQIAMFQAHFDAMLSGNLRLKSKVRFLPGGMKPFDIKNANGESLWSQRDETLIRLACYAYSVSPSPFVHMMNRSTAQNAQQMAEGEGLYPLMAFWKNDIMDTIIQEKFGLDDVEFVFLPRPEADADKQSKIHKIRLDEGIQNLNEVRDDLGLEPIEGGDIHTIKVGNAVIPVEAAAQGLAMPPQGGTGTTETGAPQPGGGSGSTDRPGQRNQNSAQRGATHAQPTTAPAVKKISHRDVLDAAQASEGDVDDLSYEQQKAGNYPKGHVWIQGLNISIENAPGSKRGKRDENGRKKWQVYMPASYGYIRGTVGADGDAIDVFVGRNPESAKVWVIDQHRVSAKGNVKGFDEHKVMLGYTNVKAALADYLDSHDHGRASKNIKRVTEMTMDEFKSWLKDGDLTAPAGKQGHGRVVLRKTGGDTISSATNLLSRDNGPVSVPRKRRKKKGRSLRGPRWLTLHAHMGEA